jgi:ATP-dependent RNA helicase RhlE
LQNIDISHESISTPKASNPSPFLALGLCPLMLRAVEAEGFVTPTPIQVQAIPLVLEGKDVLGCAQTGTGKTAAFALPMLQRLSAHQPVRSGCRPIRALIVSPTRELASQIGDEFGRYGRHTGLSHTVIFGGVGQGPQAQALRRGVDILVATPGRLWDLMTQNLVRLSDVEVLVIDEADRLLDDGFLPALRRIVAKVPKERQTLFFSATMPPALRPVADQMLRSPVRVDATPVASTPDLVDQSVYFVAAKDKRALLSHLLDGNDVTRAIVFTRTKRGADRVARHLAGGKVRAEAIHGDKSQGARERALLGLRQGSVRVLVATDVASRGLHVEDVSHVINYEMPDDPEAYVHRIGRTARAGRMGTAFSLCSWDERSQLQSIERLIQKRVRVVGEHPYPDVCSTPLASAPSPSRPRQFHSAGRRSRKYVTS